MNQPEAREQLLEILTESCGRPKPPIRPETDLLDSGLLDSLALIELLEGIEDRFGIILEPTRIPRERWRSPSSILRLIEEHQG